MPRQEVAFTRIGGNDGGAVAASCAVERTAGEVRHVSAGACGGGRAERVRHFANRTGTKVGPANEHDRRTCGRSWRGRRRAGRRSAWRAGRAKEARRPPEEVRPTLPEAT